MTEQPLPLMPEPLAPPTDTTEESDMGALAIGSTTRVPKLPGKWSVWSQAAETPGGYFLVPLDGEARELGIKFVVVRAQMPRGAAKPVIKAIRTDPHMELG